MAIGKKSGGRDFKKGQSGNPAGRPPDDQQLKQARKVNQAEVERIAKQLWAMTKEELTKFLGSPTATSLELMIGSVLIEAIKAGDHKRSGFLFDRTLGKLKTEIQLSGKDGGPVGGGAVVVITLPDNGRK